MKYKKHLQMLMVAIFGIGAISSMSKSNAYADYNTLEIVYNFMNSVGTDRSQRQFIPSTYYEPLDTNKKTKRSVSETKKKYVASIQGWRCGMCGIMLPAWFEVDHKVRLEYGGTNDVSNLEALCRECHGKKTAVENM